MEAHIFKPGSDSLVLDGIPRNLNQAILMEELIDVKHVFHLQCPDSEELVRRLERRALHDNRLDDANDTVIRKRLETYHMETAPILDFYREKLTNIDATQSPIKVVSDIAGIISRDQEERRLQGENVAPKSTT